MRFILAQTYSIYWIWRILTGQTYYKPPRGEIYLSTDLFHILYMTNFEWTDLFHTTQRCDIFKYRAIPYTGYDEFWVDRPITYHPDVRFILAQTYSIYWIWRILTGQTYYKPPILAQTFPFHILDMTNFDWTDLLQTTQRWDLFKHRFIPYTVYDEFWVDRPVPYHPEVRFI